MIISMGCKTFLQNTLPNHDFFKNKVDIEGKYLNITYDKPIANILSGEKNKNSSYKIREKTRMVTLVTFIQHTIESSSQSY